jgi:hypothetical protein
MKSGMMSSKFKILSGTSADEGSSLSFQNDSNSNRASPLNAELPIEDFDKNVSRYNYLKSVEQDLLSSQAFMNNGETSEELANQLLNMPVSEPRQMLLKLNIMENELANDMDCALPVGRKHLLLFAALKVDLITLLAELS